jgi:hypothetical protein
MTPRDNSRARRPAEHCRPRAASLALDRAVFCLDTTHPPAEGTLPLSESAGMHQIWCLLSRERQRLAAYFSLTNHSPSIAQDHISNRHIPRLETYLTPVKSTRGPVLIATKRDMHFSPLSLAFLPSRDGEEPHGAVVNRSWMIYLLTLLHAFRTQSTLENPRNAPG